jgi:hypothetical protein
MACMGNVLKITGRIEDEKRKQQIALYRSKIETIRRTVQCTSCRHKCSMCGSHLGDTHSACPEFLTAPPMHPLCDGCRAEFDEYLGIVHGERKAEVFWHNREWIRLWAVWSEYQRAIGEFRASPEFKRLCQEFDG